MTVPYLVAASFITDNLELNRRWNPCGMVMDYLPGGVYTRPAVVFTDGGTANLLWYPAPRGAQPFPFAHAFGSLQNRPNNDGDGFLGERPVRRTWSQARMLPFAGQLWCGEAQWFTTGVPRGVLDLPPPDCPRCAARMGAVQMQLQLRVRAAAVAGGDFDCGFDLAFSRFCTH